MASNHDQKRIIICRSCGADYSADLSHCPYCGTMNLPAAETEYMNRLEDMRNDLGGLESLTGQETKRSFRALNRKVLLAVVILALATGVFFGIHVYQERAEAQKIKDEYLWQREGFSQMDAYYASGDYESLLAYYLEAQDAGHQIWQYKHSAFCNYLLDIASAQDMLENYERESGDLVWLFREELYLYRLEYMRDISEDERTILAQLRAPLLEDFEMRFHLTEEELSGFQKTLARDGYLSLSDCEQFLMESGVGE